MPGIDYNKIKVYREAKKQKKFTSMGDIKTPAEDDGLNFNTQDEQNFAKQKQRYKSI